MKIEEFLEKENMSIAKFALNIGVHYTHILRIVNGQRRPSPELALKIEQATDGQVTRLELLYPENNESDNGSDNVNLLPASG